MPDRKGSPPEAGATPAEPTRPPARESDTATPRHDPVTEDAGGERRPQGMVGVGIIAVAVILIVIALVMLGG